LTVKEVNNISDEMSGLYCLIAELIYGCRLRLQECLSLRIKKEYKKILEKGRLLIISPFDKKQN